MEKSTLPAASQPAPWISDGGRSNFERYMYTFYYSPKVDKFEFRWMIKSFKTIINLLERKSNEI